MDFCRYFFVCYLTVYIHQFWPAVLCIYFRVSFDFEGLSRLMMENKALFIIIFSIAPYLISFTIIGALFKSVKIKNNFTIENLSLYYLGTIIEHKLRITSGIQTYFFNLYPIPIDKESIMIFAEQNSWTLIYFMLCKVMFFSIIVPLIISYLFIKCCYYLFLQSINRPIYTSLER